MRWKISQQPKNGQTRSRTKFAWKPVRVGLYMVWLEFYGWDETFFEPSSGSPGWWSAGTPYVLFWS